MKRLVFLVLFLVSLAGSAAEHPKEYYDPDVQRLIAVQEFAFGPVGVKGELSVGEQAFAAILKKKASVRYIVAAFDNGTPEARCYALVALREFSPQLFSDSEPTLRNNSPYGIAVRDGMTVKAVPTPKILDAIEGGNYRRYFVQHDQEP